MIQGALMLENLQNTNFQPFEAKRPRTPDEEVKRIAAAFFYSLDIGLELVSPLGTPKRRSRHVFLL